MAVAGALSLESPARRSRWLLFFRRSLWAPKWLLRGITSNERYVVREEKDRLVAKQPSLGRAEATCAALIPIRKNPSWWGLAQDERRKILRSSPVTFTLGSNISLLWPVVSTIVGTWARGEPFDFLTWFEYSPSDEPGFNRLLAELRASVEWKYVDREIDIRLVHEPA
uniref:chlorite dismutase n=1 Tax=Pluralibacter gergoviae TaxID=61647 RepID=UPI003B63C9C5